VFHLLRMMDKVGELATLSVVLYTTDLVNGTLACKWLCSW
jgi:hypothetical protein